MVNRIVVVAVLVFGAVARGEAVRVLQDFESDGDLRVWEFKEKSAALVEQHATSGKNALRIKANEYMNSFRFTKDWSGFDALEIDAFVEGEEPVAGSLLVGDGPWQEKNRSYWNRHNGSFNLRPGKNVISIPVNGLYRGEAGSRNNDIKSNIDPRSIVRVDIGFKSKGQGFVYLDRVRLVKESRPAGILAFDFGPASQAVAPGFTAVSSAAVFGKGGVTAGLRYDVGSGRARDDGFPTRLYQDYVMLEDFVVALADGEYGGWVVFDDLGYWGGEQAQHRTRSIEADGKVVWSEDRGEAGPGDYLWRFERVEPRPSDKIWDLYVKGLFEPAKFRFVVKGGKARLQFKSDHPFGTKVAAMVLWPRGIEAEAEKWIGEVEARNRREFEDKAVFSGPKPKPLAAPAEAVENGYWVGFPGVEDEVAMWDSPGGAGELRRVAAQGQRVSMTFAVRPTKPLEGEVKVGVGALKGPAGVIAAADVDVRYVQHLTQRSFNSIAYTIAPLVLRPVEGLKLDRDVTRQFWITVHVPKGTAAGAYAGEVSVACGGMDLRLPVKVEVLPFGLDEPDFLMGYYGTAVPKQVVERRGKAAWRELFRTLKEGGMNTYSGGPNIRFSGFDAKGKPMLDFSACDEFFAMAKEAGFEKAANGYGGPAFVSGLHDGYVIGNTGREWERKTGKSMGELIGIVYAAVREHAERNGWPKVQMGLIDEPRVIETARAQLELQKLYREHAPWVYIGGSYSVHWKDDPFENVVQDMFKTVQWSALNLHGEVDLAKAREFGKELLIYNQGRSRFSFGAYQWAEMHKGVRGRLQWHLLALHGYQFFDLDGREPDTAMIHWGKEGILPTIHLHRCREGADDFRYAVTLWNLAKGRESAEAKEAVEWLEGVSRQIGIGKNKPPAGWMGDEAFRGECVRRIGALSR